MLNTRELGGPQPEGVGESGRKGKGGGGMKYRETRQNFRRVIAANDEGKGGLELKVGGSGRGASDRNME